MKLQYISSYSSLLLSTTFLISVGALASFLPSQAQATCAGAADNFGVFEGTAGVDNIICDGAVLPDQANGVKGLDGNDTITINDPFIVLGDVEGGLGEDTITLNGASAQFIFGGDDKDTIVIGGGLVVAVFGNEGDDNISLNAGIANALGGDNGDDVININGGELVLGADAGDGIDTVNLAGGTLDNGLSILMGDGNDIFNITGAFLGNGSSVQMGKGDDTTELFLGAPADLTQFSFKGDDGTDTLKASNYTGTLGSVVDYENLDLQNSNVALSLGIYVFNGGAVTLNSTSTLNLGLSKTINTGAWTNDGQVIAQGDGTGVYNLFGDFVNNGLVTMASGAAGDSMSFGSLQSLAGIGSIALDAFIGGTGSPADTIFIFGDYVGLSTNLVVNPVGFDPQLTGTGPGNGIRLVAVNGITDADDFILANGPINAGAFVYDLVLESDNIWYLQSRLDDVIQAFGGVVTAAQQQGDLVQGTLHQRMGDLRNEEEQRPSKSAFQVWMRGFGGGNSVDNDTGRFEINGGRATPFDGGFDTVTYGGQGGADYGFADLFTGQDRLHLGVIGYYGHTDVDFGVLPVTADVDGYGGGVYATYVHPNFYVDTSVLAGKLEFRTTDHQRGLTDKYDGDTIGASIETGVPINLGQFVIEPQLQMTYRDVRFDSFENDNGVKISSDNGESLKGRAGARFAVNLNPSEGFLLSPYVSASVVQEFLGDNTVDADTVRVHSDVEGTSFDGGLGVTASFGNAVSVFAEAGGTVGDDVDSARGNLGVRVSW